MSERASRSLRAQTANAWREPEDDDERARRMVRATNFTQQTNALDVDKHMWAESACAGRR